MMQYIHFKEINSTNQYALDNEFDENTLIVAECQTQGRGTNLRTFNSNHNGIYMSYVTYNIIDYK